MEITKIFLAYYHSYQRSKPQVKTDFPKSIRVFISNNLQDNRVRNEKLGDKKTSQHSPSASISDSTSSSCVK